MKINLVLETQYKEQILKTIQNKLCYQEVLPTPNNRPYIVIKDVLSIKDIESIGHYLIIHTIHNQYQVREKLKNVLEQLTELSFQQIHKSYVINKKYVKEIGATEVILFKNISLPIGRKFKNIT